MARKSVLAGGWWRWGTAVVISAVIVVLGSWAYGGGDSRHHQLAWAVWVTAAFMLLVLGLLEWGAKNRTGGTDENGGALESRNYGFLDCVVGADGRISTSKVVVFAWTIELAAALVLLSLVVVLGRHGSGPGADEVFGAGDWNAYLLLLGGPFAAAVIAKGVTSSAAARNPAAKTTTADANGDTSKGSAPRLTQTASAKDVVTNDDGTLSLADTQYAIFTVVAMIYFLGALIGNVITYGKAAANSAIQIGLPPIPSALLGLTSLAALTYVGNKAVATQGVRISKLVPSAVTHDQVVTATVANLPPGSTRNNVWVSYAKDGTMGTVAPVDVNSATHELTFSAPSDSGKYTVVVYTADYASPGMQLTVA